MHREKKMQGHRERNHVMTEAEIGVMLPQAQGCLVHQELHEAESTLLRSLWRERSLATPGLQTSVGERISTVFIHPIDGTLL